LDGDGRFDSLVFEVEVNVARAGDYWIRGALAGNFAETVIDARLETGRQVIALPFDGRKVYMNKADGPYVLEGLWSTDVEDPSRADLTDNALTYAEPAYQTSPYRFGDFGVAGATLSDAYDHRVVDTDGDGYADALVLETNLNIEKAGTYTVRGVLHDAQDNMLAEATWIGSDTQVSLQFADLRETVGPYTVYLHVRNAADQVVDGVKEPLTIEAVPALSAKPIHLGGRTITPVDPTASRRPDFVITSTGYSDVGVDTDGDGRFDQLVITVGVEVEAGEGGKAYHLEGWLADANDSLISWAIGDAEVLAEGIQSLTLAFDGRMINEHGVDGPFTLVALKAAQTYTETLDEAAVAYTTSSYDSDEFEEAVAAPAMNFFADDMENWLFTGDSFESGTLNAGWTISSSTFATTAEQGRIQVTGDYGTAEGMYALLMDDFVDDDKFTLNEAIWTVDLSDVEEATLSFWHAEWDDEAHAFNGEFTGSYKADGVAISDDGTNWYPILDAPNQADGVWYFYTFDLVAEATAAGMTLGPDFKIKFQQYDNYPLPIEGSLSDGRGWDEIVIAGKGSLGDQWTSESPWDLEENMGYSYAHAWGADVSGAANGLLTATSSTDLAAYVDTTLKFATCYEMPTGSDAGYVEVSSNGLDWTKVLTLANSTSPWATQLLGLEDFDGASNLQFRFNAASQTGLSWYVDDVYLNAWPAVTGATFGYSPTVALTTRPVTFTVSYTSVDKTLPMTYTWDFGDGSAGVVTNGPTVSHLFTPTASYPVVVRVENPYDAYTYTYPSLFVAQPVVDASFSYTPTLPETGDVITFTAAHGPDDAQTPTYTWRFEDGAEFTEASGQVVTNTWPVGASGGHTVWLTVTNGYGDPVVYQYVVGVGCSPIKGTAFTYEPASPWVGDTVTFTAAYSPATGVQTPVSFTWDFAGDVQPASQDSTITYTFSPGDEYGVQLTADNNCAVVLYEETVRVHQDVATATYEHTPVQPIVGEPVAFTADYAPVTAYQPVTYTWDWGDGSAQVVTTTDRVTHTFALGDVTRTVWVTVTNPDTEGGGIVYSRTLFVAQPLSGVSLTYMPQFPLEYNPVVFSVTSQPANVSTPITYVWDFGDTSAAVITTAQTVTHAFGFGLYTVAVTATSAYQGEASAQMQVAIGGRPLESTSFDIAYAPPVGSVAFKNEAVTFTAQYEPLDALKPVTYTWNFGDHTPWLVTTTQRVAHTYAATGEYTVWLTTSNPLKDVFAEGAVQVEEPISGVTFTYASPITYGLPVEFVAEAFPADASEPITYTWDFGDGHTSMTTDPTVMHRFWTTGSHTIEVTATNAYAEASCSRMVYVQGQPVEGIMIHWETQSVFTYEPLPISVEIQPSNVTPPITYIWNFTGEPTVPTTTETASYTYTVPGVYTIWLTATNLYGEAVYSFTVEVLSHQPTWEKQVWINGQPLEGKLSEVKFTQSDVISVVDRVNLAYTYPTSFTLEEAWSDAFTLTRVVTNGGELRWDEQLLSWYVTEGSELDEHVITKTFEFTHDAWSVQMITETLTAEDAKPAQLAPKILKFWHKDVCVPIDITEVTTTLMGCIVDFEPLYDGDSPITWAWQFQGGLPATSSVTAPRRIDFRMAGTYPYTVTATNCGGERDTYSDEVTVGCPEVCTDVTEITLAMTNAMPIYTGTAVYFTVDMEPADFTPPYTYTIDYGEGGGTSVPVSGIDNPLTGLTHAYATPGTYDVEIAMWNCKMTEADAVTATVKVVVSKEPDTCVEVTSVDLSLVTTDVIYTDTVVEFSADIFPDNARHPYTYTIDYGAGASDPATSSADPLTTPLNHTFTTPGTYDLEIAVWNCGMTSPVTDVVQVVVSEKGVTCVEVTGVDLSLVTTDVIYTDTVVEFSADIFPDNARHPYTYTIDYGAGASDPATSSADPLTTPLNHTFTTPGTYDVEIAVWNCEMTSPVTDSVEVSVLSQGLIYAVALTPEAASAWDIIGSGVSYRLDVQNLGNGEDTFTLTVEGIWSADVMPDTVTLGAQETETISVTVTIPTEARDGEQDETTVTVTSDGGGASVSDSSTLTTTAVWPRLYLPLVSRDF
jgi:PKD repeat protein